MLKQISGLVSLDVRVAQKVVGELEQVGHHPGHRKRHQVVGGRVAAPPAERLGGGPENIWCGRKYLIAPGCIPAWPAPRTWPGARRRRTFPSASGQSRLEPESGLLCCYLIL